MPSFPLRWLPVAMSHPDTPLRFPDSHCRLVVIQDQLQPCPYREGITARMPLQLPIGSVTDEVTDELLQLGYRRSGDFVYRTQCPACNACEPTRVLVDQFQPTGSMKRVLRRGDLELECRWQRPVADIRRLELFNQHRSERGLSSGGEEIDFESYRSFLVDSCTKTMELSIWLDRRLVAVSIVDVGRQGTSAVYTHFDPAAGRFSLGTYAILKQIQWARRQERRYVYLGMYVSENRHLNYKARFQPQQRLIDDRWVDQ